MEKSRSSPLLRSNTDWISLFDELQSIWDDIGESDIEKDMMLFELEKDCLEIYRRKVDQASRHRAQLRKTIADSEAEIATICSAMGERPAHFRQNDRTLKEDLKIITQLLEDLRERKNERLSQLLELREQILCVSTEISSEHALDIIVDESDLSIRRLEDLHSQLDTLHKEKNDRLSKLLDQLNVLNSLCSVLDIDFKQTVSEIHPSLEGPDESKNVSSETILRLKRTIQRLREVKLQRMRTLQDFATALLEMWYLMETPIEEQQQFQNLVCNIAASEHEITEPKSLSIRFIDHVEAEVVRLEKLKASKMKELVLKKKIELDDLCHRSHIVAETDSYAETILKPMEDESIDPSIILERIEAQISIVKEEVFSRKEIVERVEKWHSACEEESWLEEYNRDENRYNAGKGNHLMLKHAEKARVVVSKIPGIVETLITKVISWENERGTEFIYDGSSLLYMLKEYNILRQEKEHERKRLRDQRRLQGQLGAEQEAIIGSKSSLSKSQFGKKLTGNSPVDANKRLSIGGATLQSPKLDSVSSFKSTFSVKKSDAFAEGIGVPESPEGGTPRRPFKSLSLSHSIPSRVTRVITRKAEEENNIPMLSPHSTPKSPTKVTELLVVKMDSQNTDMSFEERRLASLLKD